jgi:quercetin dioxygenase-like cupin family protein
MADRVEIVHCAEMPWGESLVAQRGTTAGMAHKRLFEGEEDSPDNYMLVMSREPKTYFSPRHRHPWDQIRFCLEGKIPIAKGLYIEGGEIGYFPEAAHYGPQEGGEDRIVLLLQFGGASGQGFVGPEKLKQARLELAETGTFERGVYSTEANGQSSNRDAYEAVWEHVKGAPPAYVEPAYKAPIVMRPEALPWRSTGDKGVQRKDIGVFPHRGLIVSGIRMDAGATMELERLPALRFLFVLDGRGELDGDELRNLSAARLLPGAEGQLSAAEPLEFLELAVAPANWSSFRPGHAPTTPGDP